jgi:hypothetical protein
MDRFYQYFNPFPTFSAFQGNLYLYTFGCIVFSFSALIAVIIQLFTLNLFFIGFCNCVAMAIKEIKIEIGKLDLNERAKLAKWLLDSLDDLPEAERRLDELEQGVVSAIPAKEVLRRARVAIP